MVLQRNSEVNYEDENAEDEEDDVNFAEMSDEGVNEDTFFLSLISHPYVRLLCEKILWLSLYLLVESLLYAYFIITKKELKEKMNNLVAKLMMKVCVFLFYFYDILMLEFLQ